MPRSLEVTATAIASSGAAVARLDSGKVVFVDGMLPGETARIELTSERSHFTTGVATEIVEESPDRQAPPCRYVARGCGGCQWQHIDGAAQRRFKEDIIGDALRRIGHLDGIAVEPTVALEPWRYRTTLRALVVRGRPALRKGRSHDAVAIDDCLVSHPLLADLITEVRSPDADELVLRCGSRTGERLVAPLPSNASVEAPGDVLPRWFHEEAAGHNWRISAESFFQSRPDGADALARFVLDAAEQVGSPSVAVDLYSGVGLFAGVLAQRGWQVTAVESSRSSVADAKVNLRDLPATVVRQDVAHWSPVPADVVVADPSRAGLARPGVNAVAGTGAGRVILISCDAASLGRDVALLVDTGYRVRSVTPVDLFPQTHHVEVVTVLDRRPAAP